MMPLEHLVLVQNIVWNIEDNKVAYIIHLFNMS